MTSSDDVMQALIRDIQLARIISRWCFISGSRAAWRTGGRIADGRCIVGIHCRLMLTPPAAWPFFRSPWAGMMRNAGIEVVEALKVNLCASFLRRMDLRQHRKMVLIDNHIAYTGSMNMVDPASS
jgi:cardiolipin synthase